MSVCCSLLRMICSCFLSGCVFWLFLLVILMSFLWFVLLGLSVGLLLGLWCVWCLGLNCVRCLIRLVFICMS